jgi:hypothetical protein
LSPHLPDKKGDFIFGGITCCRHTILNVTENYRLRSRSSGDFLIIDKQQGFIQIKAEILHHCRFLKNPVVGQIR